MAVAFVGLVISLANSKRQLWQRSTIFAIYLVSYLLFTIKYGYGDILESDNLINSIDFIVLPFLFRGCVPFDKESDSAEKWYVALVIVLFQVFISALPALLFPNLIPFDARQLLSMLFVMTFTLVLILLKLYRNSLKRMFNTGKEGVRAGYSFPFRLARHNIMITLGMVIIAALKFISKDVSFLCFCNVFTVLLLTGIIFSQATTEYEAFQTFESLAREGASKLKKCGIPIEKYYEIKLQMIQEIYMNEAFLDPAYSLDKLSNSLKCGRTYASVVCTEEFGGFYNLVNKARLDFAKKYLDLHPDATQQAVSEASGFASRQAMIYARKKLI